MEGPEGRGWPPATTRLDWPIALVSLTLRSDKRDVRTGELIPQRYHGKPAPVRRGVGQRLELMARRPGLDRMLKGSRLARALRRALGR